MNAPLFFCLPTGSPQSLCQNESSLAVMLLFLHKLLPLIALPLGFCITLILFALLLKKRWLAAVGVLLLYCSSVPIVGDSLLKTLEDRFPRIEVRDCPPADAIVVLSGMLHKSRGNSGTLEWGEGVDRFEQGLALMKAGKAPLIIFTGGRLPWANQQLTEGQELRTAALARGIPAEAIIVTGEVGNTADEANVVRKIAEERKLRRIILVTTAWHLPRAEYLFRTRGVPVIPFPADYYTTYDEATTALDFLPQAGALGNTETALRETYGRLYYHFFERH
jgi:uncharacterized SAM-binding protein YcdF (DUF218 family)